MHKHLSCLVPRLIWCWGSYNPESLTGSHCDNLAKVMQLIKSSHKSDNLFSFYGTIILVLFCKQKSTVSNQFKTVFFKIL